MIDKVRENRVRRAAARQGLRLVKSRRRDPRAWDFERFQVEYAPDATEQMKDTVRIGLYGEWLTLDDVETLITTGERPYAARTLLQDRDLAERWGIDVQVAECLINDAEAEGITIASVMVELISLADVERLESEGRAERMIARARQTVEGHE